MLLFHGALLGDGCVWSPPVYRDLSPSSYLGWNRKNLIGELRKYIAGYDTRQRSQPRPQPASLDSQGDAGDGTTLVVPCEALAPRALLDRAVATREIRYATDAAQVLRQDRPL
jgi:hypothetical protein